MLSFLSSWVLLSPSFPWTTNFDDLHSLHIVTVFVEFGGKKDLVLRTLPSLNRFLFWSFCHHSISTSMWMSTDFPQGYFARIYSF